MSKGFTNGPGIKSELQEKIQQFIYRRKIQINTWYTLGRLQYKIYDKHEHLQENVGESN